MFASYFPQWLQCKLWRSWRPSRRRWRPRRQLQRWRRMKKWVRPHFQASLHPIKEGGNSVSVPMQSQRRLQCDVCIAAFLNAVPFAVCPHTCTIICCVYLITTCTFLASDVSSCMFFICVAHARDDLLCISRLFVLRIDIWWLGCEHLSVAGCVFWIDFCCVCRFEGCDASNWQLLAVWRCVACMLGFLMQHVFEVSVLVSHAFVNALECQQTRPPWCQCSSVAVTRRS